MSRHRVAKGHRSGETLPPARVPMEALVKAVALVARASRNLVRTPPRGRASRATIDGLHRVARRTRC